MLAASCPARASSRRDVWWSWRGSSRRGREKNRHLGPWRNRIGAPEPPRHLNPKRSSRRHIASSLRPSFFVFASFCSPPPNQSTPPPGTLKQCAHQTLRVSLHDVRPCFDWHSRRRSNALCIAPFLLSGTSPSILPYFPARPPPTEPQHYETTMGLSGHSTPHSLREVLPVKSTGLDCGHLTG